MELIKLDLFVFELIVHMFHVAGSGGWSSLGKSIKFFEFNEFDSVVLIPHFHPSRGIKRGGSRKSLFAPKG